MAQREAVPWLVKNRSVVDVLADKELAGEGIHGTHPGAHGLHVHDVEHQAFDQVRQALFDEGNNREERLVLEAKHLADCVCKILDVLAGPRRRLEDDVAHSNVFLSSMCKLSRFSRGSSPNLANSNAASRS